MLYFLANKFPTANTRTLTIKPGWILSKYMDPLIFVGLSIFCLSIPILFKLDYTAMSYVVWLILANGHAICSIYPVLFSIKRGATSTLLYFFLSIGCIAYSIILSVFNPELLYLTYTITLTWHFARQKIGWVHYSTKKIKDTKNLCDEIIIYNVCLMPLIWRLIENNNTDIFFSALTIPYHISLNFWSVPIHLHLKAFSIVLFWGINIIWFFKEIKTILNTGIINPVKYYIILSGIICFSVSYAFFGSGMYWWTVNSLVHTISYTLFTYSFSKNHEIVKSEKNKNRTQYIFLKNIFLYLLLVLIYGSITAIVAEYGRKSVSWWAFNFLWPLMVSTFFIHCSVDAFIWKKRFIGKILKT